MQNWQPTNPVERRMMAAHEDWLAFANDKSARLLYWHTNEADVELLKVFFQGQRELSNAVLELSAPFDRADQYPADLAEEIIAFYDARREGSVRTGIVADWRPPVRNQTEASHYLFAVLDSLMSYHPDVFPGMVLVLAPAGISKPKAFEACLDELLELLEARYAGLSRRMRLVLWGTDADAYTWLENRQPQTVRRAEGVYQMQALPRELAAQSGERGAAGQFRRLFVELTESLAHEDPSRLERLRASALAVSDGKKWFDQSATVHLLAGAAYLKWGSEDHALNAYREATMSAHQARDASHPAGNKLVVNGLFGEASVQITRGRYLEAARCYAKAAEYADADKDGVLLVESYRMQAWCLDRERERDAALDAGFQALRAGEGIEPALRSNSNLQLAAGWMLDRINWLHIRRGELERTLEALYGAHWKEALNSLSPADVSAQLMDDEKSKEDPAS
ncbi:hypothetical protein AWB78_04610 [Caballeronia calidae]|uniref:Tetratricopeptide repeat protein n=1 Tax=Caballeronia calidae TaxID=1777139 RepID=A0A158D1M6_9BURK|nr:hypothetical protein [Caballeronia calidae]SAK88371.1 hypothetical protein AWB78_04610 [Caballeronia calidae]